MTCDLCADDGCRPWCVKACRDCGALTLVEAREALSRETRERVRGSGDRLGRHRHRGRGSLEEAGLFRDRDRAARLGAAGPLRSGDRPAPRRTHGGVRDAGVDRGEGAAYRRPGARRRRRDRQAPNRLRHRGDRHWGRSGKGPGADRRHHGGTRYPRERPHGDQPPRHLCLRGLCGNSGRLHGRGCHVSAQAQCARAGARGRPQPDGERAAYPGAWAFARAHFFDTHAATFGKTTRATQCEPGRLELIEREEGPDYLRVILKDGLVAGAQAIGRYADWIGLFMSAMWRKESLPAIRENWPAILRPGSPHPWTSRKLGELIGLRP